MYLPTKKASKKWMKYLKILLKSDSFNQYKESKIKFLNSIEYENYLNAEDNANCKIEKILSQDWDEAVIYRAQESPRYFEWVLEKYKGKFHED